MPPFSISLHNAPLPAPATLGRVRLIRLTPPGRGAVTTLRVEGPGALAIVEQNFHARSGRPLSDSPPLQIVVGRLGMEGEEVVVRPTSSEVVELHCHGGLAAVARLEAIFTAAGCQLLDGRTWIAEQEGDPFAAAARLDLAEARTARTASILLDQHRGALRNAVAEIEALLANGRPEIARKQAEALLAHKATGSHLVHPWQVVVAGKPNVGKSSLINRIAGYQRTIVHSRPGTTRDIVGVQTALDGWPVEIFDTAGLRESDDEIERSGIALARRKLRDADQIVLVFDASAAWTAADMALAADYPLALKVYNKIDLPTAGDARPPGLEVSALNELHIEALCREIAARLVPNPPLPGTAVPFRSEQVEQIQSLMDRTK